MVFSSGLVFSGAFCCVAFFSVAAGVDVFGGVGGKYQGLFLSRPGVIGGVMFANLPPGVAITSSSTALGGSAMAGLDMSDCDPSS